MKNKIDPFSRSAADLLLAWFEVHRRRLPWRENADPYRVMVSEFMLQQTQVETVVPYYGRFLEAFPDIRSLANAPLSSVLKAWEGLGYYARARNLHRTAGEIVSRFDGRIPDGPDLASLPGFGPYTTGAVLSIAFGQDCAAVDGNVTRVLCRLFDIRDEVNRPEVRRRIACLAQEMTPPGRAGLYNQAVMELGALVCRSRNPSCDACPLRERCAGRAAGDPGRLPVKPKPAARPHHEEAVGMVWDRKRESILISRRKEEGLLGGLWELPGGRRAGSESLGDCCVRGVKEQVGAGVTVIERLRTVEHGFTHFSVTIHGFRCAYRSGRIRPRTCSEVLWVDPEDLRRFAFPRAHRRLVEGMLAAGGPGEVLYRGPGGGGERQSLHNGQGEHHA